MKKTLLAGIVAATLLSASPIHATEINCSFFQSGQQQISLEEHADRLYTEITKELSEYPEAIPFRYPDDFVSGIVFKPQTSMPN